MIQNPHLPSEWRGHGPNQRHQDWESGHAIGYSKGLREGIATAKGLLYMSRLALKSDAILMANKGLNEHLIAALEVMAEDPVVLHVEGTDQVIEVEP